MGAAALVRRPLLLSGGGHLGSVRRSLTARGFWRAAAINEINLNRLKARILAGSHQSSNGVS